MGQQEHSPGNPETNFDSYFFLNYYDKVHSYCLNVFLEFNLPVKRAVINTFCPYCEWPTNTWVFYRILHFKLTHKHEA